MSSVLKWYCKKVFEAGIGYAGAGGWREYIRGGDGHGDEAMPEVQADDAGGAYGPNLCHNEGEACGNFFIARGAVAHALVSSHGRTELADVGDVDFCTAQAHGGDDLREFLAGRADKGLLLQFLFVAGGFAYEHEPGVGIAGGKDHGVAQRA